MPAAPEYVHLLPSGPRLFTPSDKNSHVQLKPNGPRPEGPTEQARQGCIWPGWLVETAVRSHKAGTRPPAQGAASLSRGPPASDITGQLLGTECLGWRRQAESLEEVSSKSALLSAFLTTCDPTLSPRRAPVYFWAHTLGASFYCPPHQEYLGSSEGASRDQKPLLAWNGGTKFQEA